MDFTEFNKLIEDDPHLLSYKIKKGKMSFSSLTKWLNKVKNVPLIDVAYVMHPDCTLGAFKKTYKDLLKTPNIHRFKSTILLNARIFNNMDAIAFILNVKNTEDLTIKSSYPLERTAYKNLVKNPHINPTFKIIYYDLTGDEKFLPSEATDIFLF